MKKAILYALLLHHCSALPYCVDQLWSYCTFANCIIVGMLLHNIWTWHITGIELNYCEQEIKKNNDMKNELSQKWRSSNDDSQLKYTQYRSLKNYYSETIRQLSLRQIKATIKKEQSTQGIYAGIAGNLVKLY